MHIQCTVCLTRKQAYDVGLITGVSIVWVESHIVILITVMRGSYRGGGRPGISPPPPPPQKLLLPQEFSQPYFNITPEYTVHMLLTLERL